MLYAKEAHVLNDIIQYAKVFTQRENQDIFSIVHHGENFMKTANINVWPISSPYDKDDRQDFCQSFIVCYAILILNDVLKKTTNNQLANSALAFKRSLENILDNSNSILLD